MNRTTMKLLAAAIAYGLAGATAAQDPLPRVLSGGWTVNKAGTPAGAGWSIEIDRWNVDGSFEGKLTYLGDVCGARNEPMTGKLEGNTLTLNAGLKPTVTGSECGDAAFTLRKGTSEVFEGTVDIENVAAKPDVYLSP